MDAQPYRRLGPAVAAVAAGVALAGCGGSGGVKADPQTLLRQAKAAIDATPAVHFTLTSRGVSGSGTNITGGQGDVVRPDQLLASFTVTVDGLGASVKVASKGGVFEAQLPFSNGYTRTNPASFGFSNPAQILDPNKGLSSLLLSGTGARVTGQERLSGELLDEVTTTVPGTAVPVLPNANPSKPVAVTAAIDPANHQLRQVTLVGPFTSSTNSTFIVTLTNYGEQTTIDLPPA
jgi:lipoprotein LprG